MESLLKQELPKSGDVREVTLLLAAVELHQGNAAQAEGRLRDLASTGRQRGEDTQTLGWLRVYADQISESNIMANFGDSSPPPLFDSLGMRTLAVLYAETGKTADALTTLGRSIDLSGRREPNPDEWYVLGRIYEQYGERAAAESAYRRALDRQKLRPTLDSAYALAQRALNRLGSSR